MSQEDMEMGALGGENDKMIEQKDKENGSNKDETDGGKNESSKSEKKSNHKVSKHAEDERRIEEEEEQLALIKSKQAIRRHSQFDSSDINSVASENLPNLLFYSCEKGLNENVDVILKLDPNLDLTRKFKKPELYPLHVAARKGNSIIIGSILEYLRLSNLDTLNVVLKQTNVFGNSIFHIIMKSMSKSRERYGKCMDVLMTYKEHFEENLIIEKDHSLICDASEEGLEDFVGLLLKHGANPRICLNNRGKRNSLQLACSNGNYKILSILIDHVKNIEKYEGEILPEFLNYKDEGGNTALHIILAGKDREIKENKKDKNEEEENIINDALGQNEGEETNTDREDKYMKCMKLLLSEKEFIDIDAVNNEDEKKVNNEYEYEGGNTALHRAAQLSKNKKYKDKSFFETLIAYGAKRDIKNKKGDIAEIFDANQNTKNEMENREVKNFDAQSQNLDTASIVESVSDIKESERILQETLTNGNHMEVKKLFEKICKRMKPSLNKVNNYLDIIIKGQISKNTEELSKNKKKRRKGDNNVDFIECMDEVLKYIKATFDDHEEIIDKVLFSVCNKGILNFVETLLKYDARYIEPINKSYKRSSLQISFDKGYHLIAEKLVKHDESIQLSDDVIKDISKYVVDGFTKKMEGPVEEQKRKEKEKDKKKKKKNTSDEIENEENYEKCFELLLDPNLNFHKYQIKDDEDIVYKICSNGSTQLADCLFNYNADPFIEFSNDTKFPERSPILIASRNGYHEFVGLWLKKMEERKDEKKMKNGLQMTNTWKNLAIHNVVRSVAMKDKNRKKEEKLCDEIDYYKCLEKLLEYKKYYNINAQDCQGNTALHYAIQLRDDNKYIKLLLMNGSEITIKNKKRITAKSKIPPSLIEELLDECVQAEGDESVVDDLKITIDLSLFSHNHDSDIKSETDFLIALRNSSNHKHLFSHPVISTFLYIKWQKIRVFWYINLFLYMLFFSSLIAYVCLIESGPNYTVGMVILMVIISMMCIYIFVREIVQLSIFKLSYFKSFDNLLELSLLGMTFVLLIYHQYPNLHGEYLHNDFRAWIVVGSIIEFILLFGKIPLFPGSIYITMFKKVTFHFFKIIIVLFLWIILAFSFCFYILFNLKSNSSNTNSSITNNDNSFETFSKSLLKTAVMSTGEMDYGNMDLYLQDPVSSNLMFSLFLFVIVFVVMNLINGIAISDIQTIQKEAENHAVMAEAECIIGINKTLSVLIRNSKFFKRIWNNCLIFDDCFTKKSISVFPNRHYEHVWASCEGHHCSLTNRSINHCPYYFWLNLRTPLDLLRQMRYMEKCKDCKIYYDKRVQTKSQSQNKSQNQSQNQSQKQCHINYHQCGKKYECGICKRWKYKININSPIKIHDCLHRHRYFIKNMSIKDAKDIVIKKREEEEKERKKQSKILEEIQRKDLQSTVRELSEIIKKMQIEKDQKTDAKGTERKSKEK